MADPSLTPKRRTPRGTKPGAPNATGVQSHERHQGSDRARHVKRASSELPIVVKTIPRDDGTSLVVEVLRPSRDARIVFATRDASNPRRSRRPAFVVVRAAELEAVIAALVSVRASSRAERGAP